MAHDFAKAFYSSKAWQDCREEFARSRRYLCENCLQRGILSHGEIVHHIIELTPANINDPDVTLNFKNLRLVCRKCHAQEHGNKRRYFITADGRVIARDI